MSTEERLAYMANQIARNFIAEGRDKAVLATADHIAAFWDPRMKARVFAQLDGGEIDLDDVAADAVRLLRDRGAPPPQTPATVFNAADEAGASDAG